MRTAGTRISAGIIVCLALSGLFAFGSEAFAEGKRRLKIGFIYSSPIGDAGWSYAHDLARRELAMEPANSLYVADSVPEDAAAEQVIRTMSNNGCDIVVTTSFGYMEATLKVALEYPRTTYLHCSGYKTAENVSNFFGRMYQARYLSGMTAGGMTKSNIIGFVAAFPLPEVIRAINAFTLGARETNPDAEVRVVWTKTWYDPPLERRAAEMLIAAGADVVAQHQNSPAAQEAAQEKGVYSVGYNTDMSAFAPDAHLVSAVWHWVDFYADMVDKVRAGRWTSGSFWPGMDTGIVDISPFGPMVPEALRQTVMARRDDILAGRYTVFKGPVLDREGRERITANRIPGDQELLGMDWFVRGVTELAP